MGSICATIDLLLSPKPSFTEANLPDQSGKVFIITGSSGGIGKELARMLSAAGATIYIAARSRLKADAAAAADIRLRHPSSPGRLEHLALDLADLSAVRVAAEDFLSRERRLDVLWNNAGVMVPPARSATAQGHELQMGTNALGPYLFTRLLYPLMASTAAMLRTQAGNDGGSVRVVWVASNGAQMAPDPPVDFGNMDYGVRDESQLVKYYRSKAADVLYAIDGARRSREMGDGVISVALDPGLIESDLGRTTPVLAKMALKPFMRSTWHGACTELFAGLHESITLEHNGAWVVPFGRIFTKHLRSDLRDEETTRRFCRWSDEQIQPFL